jgi:phage terminase large subunit
METEVLYTRVFEDNLAAYEAKKHRVIANEGSARSSKTISICQLLALYIPFNEEVSISVVSPSLPHLKRGARRDILNLLNDSGIYDDDNFNKTDNIYHYPETESYLEFFGADDAGKVRGPGRKILYINEANLLSFEIYKQLALRTEQVIFIDYNPADESSWVYEVADDPRNVMIHSTYKDNPFLPEPQIWEIESLQSADENLWKVFGLGLRGSSTDLIFTHAKKCKSLPGKGERIKGQDFGYTMPSALVDIEIYEGAVYVDELIYEPKLTTSDLIERYKSLGIDKKEEIFCDAAEPKTIEEIRRAKYNVKPADKDVTEGIRKVKSMPLYITERSANIWKEIKSYKWRTQKNPDGGESNIDEPVKFNDHAMDAIRYAVFTKLSKPRRKSVFA